MNTARPEQKPSEPTRYYTGDNGDAEDGDKKLLIGDWFHDDFNLRITEESVSFFGSRFFLPEEFHYSEVTVGSSHVKFVVYGVSLDDCKALWNLKLADGHLSGEIFVTGKRTPSSISFRRMSDSDATHVAPAGVSKLDRMMMSETKSSENSK